MATKVRRILEIPLSEIDVSQNPRGVPDPVKLARLAASIKASGVLQPLLVGPPGRNGKRPLIAGKRRLLGAKAAGLKTVPVEERESNPREAAIEAIVSNLTEELGAWDLHKAYVELRDVHEMTVPAIAEATGDDDRTVRDVLSWEGLGDTARFALQSGKLAESHATVLARIRNPAEQEKLAKRIVGEQLTRAETRELVATRAKAVRPRGRPPKDPGLRPAAYRPRKRPSSATPESRIKAVREKVSRAGSNREPFGILLVGILGLDKGVSPGLARGRVRGKSTAETYRALIKWAQDRDERALREAAVEAVLRAAHRAGSSDALTFAERVLGIEEG